MIEGLILPDVDHPEAAPFWAGCADGELRVQSFSAISFAAMAVGYQTRLAVACAFGSIFLLAKWNDLPHSAAHQVLRSILFCLIWADCGRVWSVVIPHPPLLPAYGDQAPYNVVVVELEDDPAIRFVGNVVIEAGAPLNSIEPHTIEIGDEVQVVFSHVAEDVWLPQWMSARG